MYMCADRINKFEPIHWWLPILFVVILWPSPTCSKILGIAHSNHILEFSTRTTGGKPISFRTLQTRMTGWKNHLSQDISQSQSETWHSASECTAIYQVGVKSNKIGSAFDFCLKEKRVVHRIVSGYCHAGSNLEKILKVFSGLIIYTHQYPVACRLHVLKIGMRVRYYM